VGWDGGACVRAGTGMAAVRLATSKVQRRRSMIPSKLKGPLVARDAGPVE